MNRTAYSVGIGVVGGFALGGALVGGFVYMRCAHHVQVCSEERVTLNGIDIVRRNGFDYHGIGFLEPDGTSLTIESKGGVPITIYKSQRMFQEGVPAIGSVRVVDGRLAWEDGLFSYDLMLKRLKTECHVTPSSTSAQVAESDSLRQALKGATAAVASPPGK